MRWSGSKRLRSDDHGVQISETVQRPFDHVAAEARA
jgi:hypothetical protein